jgi:uncharacterized protein (DUF2336 family)
MIMALNELQKLIKEPSKEARAETAQSVAVQFSKGKFSDSEKQIAIEIFRLLLKDVEIKVRKMLSVHLAHSMEAPHDVILSLAQDINEVSLPVLQNSYVLTEEDLIAITRSTQDINIMSTIARRESVSRELSEALLAKSNIKVIETLLTNKSATISDQGLENIQTTCPDNISILELMVNRGDLPVTLAEKLFVAVSDEMKQVLAKRYHLSLQVANSAAKDVREVATLGLMSAESKTMDIDKLVNQLYQKGRLTFSMVIRSLCLGDMRFFELALAKLADIPVTNVQLLILDQGPEGFESLYKTSCLPMELFSATQYLMRTALEETSFGRYQRNDFRQRLANRLMQDEAVHNIQYMDYLITLIQNNIFDAAPAN